MQWPRCFFAVAVLAAVGLAAVVCQPASAPPQPHPPPHRPPLPPASASIGLVVAAHSGAASWLDEFKYSTDVWVYSKGRTCTPFSKRGLRCVPLANYGREGASYLHHIVSRWDDLAELTVFAQEEPQEHSPDFLTLVRTFISNSSFASLAEVGGALPLTDRFRDVAVPGPIPPREQRELLRVPSAGHCRVYTETRDREMVPVGPHAFSYSKGDLQKVIRRWRKDHKVPSGESTLDFIWRHFEFCGGLNTTPAIRSRPLSFWSRWLEDVKDEWPRWPHLTSSVVLEQLWMTALRYRPAAGVCSKVPPMRPSASSCFRPAGAAAWANIAETDEWKRRSCAALAAGEGPRLPRDV